MIAGHGRVLAARQLGLERVLTIRLEHLSEEQAKGFTIADSRLTEDSVWDERQLGEQLKELSLLNLDFSLEATGFEMGEIGLKIEGLNSPSDEEDPVDAIPTRAGPTVSTVGDSGAGCRPSSKPTTVWNLPAAYSISGPTSAG